jgi:putative intracellular protease/amidase
MTVLLFDGFTALDVVGGYEVLANVPGIEVEFAAASAGIVASDTRRLGMLAYRRLDDIDETDILYVPGGPGVVAALADARLLAWIRRMHERASWTVGICNGVAVLAAAGILAGRTVTTNWGWRERVAAYGVEVVPARFHRDGQIVTGAGVSASIDAGLFLADLIAGEDVARLIQLGIEYYPSPPPFLRADVDDVPAAESDLVLAFEAGAPGRLATTQLPWAVGVD